MINKEKIKVVKGDLDYYITASEDLGEVAISDLEDVLKCIIELEKDNKRLEEINEEQNNIINNYIEERKEVAERLKAFLTEIKQDGIYGYDGDIQEILSILKGETEDDE